MFFMLFKGGNFLNNNEISQVINKAVSEVEKIIVGKKDKIKIILMSILSEGHILIEDIPGVGKTTLIKTLSQVLGCSFKRIQFTPDLLPSDIVGINIYNQKSGDFQFVPGPIMTNILLADEINRAIPRTQSALLESMEEKQFTVDGKTWKLQPPFIVMATQNPIESEGTFPLPAAQMDRFMIRITLGYPSKEEEGLMLKNLGDEVSMECVQSILSSERIVELQNMIHEVYIDNSVTNYIVELVQATRQHPMIKVGASPRASRALYKGSKVWAAMKGRNFVTPDDVQEIAGPILNHRLILTSEARMVKKSLEDIINEIIVSIAAPPKREKLLYGR